MRRNSRNSLSQALQKFVFVLCTILSFYNTLNAQALSKTDLLNDLKFLNEALVHGHPVNFKNKSVKNLNHLISEVSDLYPDSLSAFDYTVCIEKAIFQIGCVHTSIIKNPLAPEALQPNYFPFKLKTDGHRLLLVDYINKSKTILVDSINHVASNEIIKTFSFYKASDGGSDAFSKSYFFHLSPFLLPQLFKNPVNYIISSEQKDTLIYSKKSLPPILDKSLPEKVDLFNNSNYFIEKNQNGYLRVNSFSKSDKRFFKKVFYQLKQSNSDTLIIDLRENLGGNRKAAVHLTRYLVKSNFSYSILQPKLKPWKYLSRQGKLYYSLSKIKYNFIGLLHRKKNSLGKEFRYRYTPKRKNHFNGAIFVLVDGFSVSSSSMVTSWLKQYSNVRFLGSQMGGGYNGNCGGAFPNIELPASKIRIYFPVYRLILDYASDQADGIIPELAIPNEFAGFKLN